MVSGPYMDDNLIKGVFVESKSGRQLILCKVVIDATGDGDIAARAGAKYEIKPKETIQPCLLYTSLLIET